MSTLSTHIQRAGFVAALFLPSATALVAQTPALLTPVANPAPGNLAWDRQEKASDPAIRRSQFVRVDATELRHQIRHGFRPLQVDLFGKPCVLELDRSKLVLGYEVVCGTVRGRGGDVVLVLASDGTAFGTIHLVEESYAIVHAAHGDVHVLQDLDETRRPIRPRSIPVTLPDPGNTNPPRANSNNNATLLDVAVFYTPRALATAGSQHGIETAIIGGIEMANITNRNSSVDAEFRAVFLDRTNYTENGSSNDLGRFRSNGDGYMDEVHGKRNACGADLMHLITQPTKLQYCGVAYLMTSVSSGFANFAFGVTVRSCISSNVIAHEMGHNIGCHHDRNNAGGAVFNHAYGFRTSDSKYRTVMAYAPGSRVNVWSSPNVRYQNYVMGRANSEDNALTITKTKLTVSNFRAAKAVTFQELNGEIKGFLGGAPKMRGYGTPNTTFPPRLHITGQRYLTPGLMVFGGNPVNVPYLGGILVPNPQVFMSIPGVLHDITIDASALSKLPPRAQLWIQAFFSDYSAQQGVSATNGMHIIMP